MDRKNRRLGDAELEIMLAIWEAAELRPPEYRLLHIKNLLAAQPHLCGFHGS